MRVPWTKQNPNFQKVICRVKHKLDELVSKTNKMQIYYVCWRYRCQPQNYVPSVHTMITILCTLHFYFTFIKLKFELEHLESVSVECYSLWLIVSEFTKNIFLNIYPRSASMQKIRYVELEMHWIKSANISHIGLLWMEKLYWKGKEK